MNACTNVNCGTKRYNGFSSVKMKNLLKLQCFMVTCASLDTSGSKQDAEGQWMKVAKCISASHLPKSIIILQLTVAFCDLTVLSQPKCATG